MSSMNLSLLNQHAQRFVQRFLWDPEPKNTDLMNSIWLLGQEYPNVVPPAPNTAAPIPASSTPAAESNTPTSPASSTAPSESSSSELAWPPAFLVDFESRIWITYRNDFPAIPRSSEPDSLGLLTTLRSKLPDNARGFTSDSGWGCMIRSGQSVLANALQILHLGREWRRGMLPEEERRLLALFADDPRAPFSIHKFVAHGELACGKHPGEWFGPSAAAKCIQALVHSHEEAGLRVYNTRDVGEVYEESLRKTATVDGKWQPTLVLVGLRLGIERVTAVYWEALKACVQLKQSVGIAGGRPSASHYFVGVQGDHFFYLDPHTCRPIFPLKDDPAEYTEEEVNTCHTRRLRRLNVKEMDPSMLLAFLIKDEADFKDWKKGVEKVQGKRVVLVAEGVEPPVHGHTGGPRDEAVAEVEAFDDEPEEDGDDGWVQS